MILDEDRERRLRYLFDQARFAFDKDDDPRIIPTFKDKCLDYDYTEEEQDYVIRSAYPDHGSPAVPEEIVPEPWFSEPQTETKKPKPARTWTQQHGKRQAQADAAKALIVLFLNQGENSSKGFRISELHQELPFTKTISERQMRRYMEELFKDRKVKRWVKPVVIPDGKGKTKQIRHHYYTGACNKNPYYKWVNTE